MSKRIYIGIDPGKGGAIAWFDDTTWGFYKLELIGTEVDVHSLVNKLRELCCELRRDAIIGIEDVHAIFGTSANSTFELGWICGILEGIAISMGAKLVKIAPKKWQSEMHEGIPKMTKLSSTKKTLVTDTKSMSIMACKRLFPDISLVSGKTARAKKEDHNIADALLICEYLRRNY
jgi:hypothetical protein